MASGLPCFFVVITLMLLKPSYGEDVSGNELRSGHPPLGWFEDCPADVIFIVDTAGDEGTSNLNLMKTFIIDFIEHVELGSDEHHARMGLITYGETYDVVIRLDRASPDETLVELVNELVLQPSDHRNLAGTIRVVREQGFSVSKGDRYDQVNVAILITSGKPDIEKNSTLSEVKLAAKQGIFFVVVGIGDDVDMQELRNIASAPSLQTLHLVNSYSDLDPDMLKVIIPFVCETAPGLTSVQVGPVTPMTVIDLSYCKADIGIVLDGSGSVGEDNWQLMLQFVKDLASMINLQGGNSGGTRIGIVTFGNDASVKVYFDDYRNYEEFVQKVNNIGFRDENTNTAAGIRTMRTELFDVERGDRPDVFDIGMVITDGVPTWEVNQTIPEADLAREEGIHLFAVGIGDELDPVNLAAIASDSDEKYLFYVEDFQVLVDEYAEKILSIACTVSTGDTTPAPSETCGDRDFAFIVDASGSIGLINWMIMQDFLKDFTEKLPLASHKNQLGLVTFSTTAEIEAPLGEHTSHDSFHNLVDQMQWKNEMTNTSGALWKTHSLIFHPDNGDRSDHDNVAIVFTDGHPNVDHVLTSEMAHELRDKATVFTIGIGTGVLTTELQAVASLPPYYHVTLIEEYEDLEDYINHIHNLICAVSYPNPDFSHSFIGGKADITVIVDASSDIGSSNFDDIEDFLESLFDSMYIDNVDGHKVAIITTGSGGADIALDFDDYNSKSALLEFTGQVNYIGGSENFRDALDLVTSRLYGGSGSSRADVDGVVLIITSVDHALDAADDDEVLEKIKYLKHDLGLKMMALAVGDARLDQEHKMGDLVSENAIWYLKVVEDYDHLTDLVGYLEGAFTVCGTKVVWACGFESSTDPLCQFQQSDDDDYDWTVGSLRTLSEHTGPDGAVEGRYYLYIETSSPRKRGDDAIIYWPNVQMSGDHCLHFYYNMYGWHIGTLLIYIERGDLQQNHWMANGPQGSEWKTCFVQLVLQPTDTIGIKAIRADAHTGDIALDHLQLRKGPCPNHLGYHASYRPILEI